MEATAWIFRCRQSIKAKDMRIAVAQMKGFLGDFEENRKKASVFIERAREGRADLLLFPEGGLFGYPPKDLLLQSRLIRRQNREIALLRRGLPPSPALLLPAFAEAPRGKARPEGPAAARSLQNGALLLEKGKKPRFFAKEFLPDQGVFWESRYFAPGKARDNVFIKQGIKFQVLICEDMWQARSLKSPGALLCLNGSPYTDEKQKARLKKMREWARKCRCPAFYVNRAGGQDELIFDGGSFILDGKGGLRWQGAFFAPDFVIWDLRDLAAGGRGKRKAAAAASPQKAIARPLPPLQARRRRALVLGIQDFCAQTGFSKAHLGLSGGMDSALAAFLAAEALGPENIHGMFLPGPYTGKVSRRAVRALAKNLGIRLTEKNITPFWKSAMRLLFPAAAPANPVTSQNLQSRIRTLVLMAESNESGSLLLGTGNKSELAVGYSALYGDLSGGLLPIGDLWKTEVYDLARAINEGRAAAEGFGGAFSAAAAAAGFEAGAGGAAAAGGGRQKPVFPEEILLREPSAELAPRQKDSDDLLPYSVLDPFLRQALRGAAPRGEGERKMAALLENSEFKRRQAPPVLKISGLAFGDGRRIPIAYKKPPL